MESVQPTEPAVVYCQLALTEIDVAVCEKEQKPRACFGCRAATRRCRRCSAPGVIEDAKRCLCAKCLALGKPGDKPVVAIRDTDTALRDFVLRLREARTMRLPLCFASVSWKHKNSPEDERLPETLPADQAFAILCQHIVLSPSGLRIIKAPLATLLARAQIVFADGVAILETLQKQGVIVGKHPWEIIAVVPEVNPTPMIAEAETEGICDDDDPEEDEDDEKDDLDELDDDFGEVGLEEESRQAAPADCAEPVLIPDASVVRAGRDGFFTAKDGCVWGMAQAISQEIGVKYPTLQYRIKRSSLVSCAGKDCGGRTRIFYRLEEVRRTCA
jgi:hypothetical protein